MRALLVVVFAALLPGCPAAPAGVGCLTAVDCPAGEVCAAGRCASIDAAVAPDTGIDSSAVLDSATDGSVDASFDTNGDGGLVCRDGDGDGYADATCGGDDCDDGRPDVHPGALEACNGVDDDCAGDGDLGATCTPFEHTADTACRAGACTFTTCSMGALDCDLLPSNGCEIMATTCPYAPPRLVAPLSAMAVTSNRPELRYELATGTTGARIEICDDAACTIIVRTLEGTSPTTVDMALRPGRYYWRAFGRVGSSVGTTPSATWTFYTYATSTPPRATTAFPLFDLDGNTADALFGAPASPTGEIRWDSDATPAVRIFTGPAAGFGSSIGTVDVDGDGISDAVIGACAGHVDLTAVVGPSSGCARAAYVYRGIAGGFASAPLRMHGSYASDMLHDGYGYSVAGIGDFDGDGYGDYAVGMYGENATIVYFGGAGERTAMLAVVGRPPSAGIGLAVASAGDLDGDHRDELLVGSAEGVLRIYHFDAADPIAITTPCRSVSGLGDIDGDGLSDFAASSGPGTTRSVAVYRGATDRTYLRAWTASGTGAAVIGAGDFDGNGLADVAVSTGEPERLLQYYRGFDGAVDVVALISARSPTAMEPGFGRWLGRAGTPGSPIVLEGSHDAAVTAPVAGMALTRASRYDAGTASIVFFASWTGGVSHYGGAVVH